MRNKGEIQTYKIILMCGLVIWVSYIVADILLALQMRGLI